MIAYYLFIGFGNHVAFIDVVMILAILSLITNIPITLNGLGIRELGAVYLFGLIGNDAVIVTSVFLTSLILRYITAVIIIIFQFENFMSVKKKTKVSL